MIKGIQRSGSGMIPRVQKQEAIANNIANVGTAGFKKEVVFTHELSKAHRKTVPKETDWEIPTTSGIHTHLAQGTFDKTDNPLDLAIDGEGYFKLESPEGKTVLTRSGTFQVDNSGYIVFPGGFRLSSEGGPIQVAEGTVNVSQNGEVSVNGTVSGQISLVTISDPQKLLRIGGALHVAPESEELQPVRDAAIRQGYLETANVDVVTEMVDMIVTYRIYEANAKALQTQDTTLDHLFQRVAPRP